MQTETKNGFIIRRFDSLNECVSNSEKPATGNESDWQRTATDNGGVRDWLGITTTAPSAYRRRSLLTLMR
jgi:hypothetical protein